MKILLGAIILFSLIGCSIDRAQSAGKNIMLSENVYVVVQEDIEVSKESPVEDFDVVSFKINGEEFLQCYVGNAPGFPLDEKTNVFRKETTGGFTKSYAYKGDVKSQNSISEVLVDLNTTFDWPMFLHFMIYCETGDSRNLAFSIIESVSEKD